jgi:protein involved in polysaccharide export with SLBB domain
MIPRLRTVFFVLIALCLPLASLWSQTAGTGAAPTGPAAAATARPGDRIALRIWNEPEMSGDFTISDRGEVVLPRLGSVPVTGRPIGALQDSLRQAYAVFLRNPSVEVIVLRRVGVQGEVRTPGNYMVDLTLTLPEILTMAGGLTEAANPNHVVLLRGGERIRYGRKNQSEFLAAELRSGDQVIVRPRSVWARNPLAMIGGIVSIIVVAAPVIERIWPERDTTTNPGMQ